MTRLRFFVPGVPAPQGSKSVSRAGRPYEANPALLPWRATVTAYAIQACEGMPRPLFPKGTPVSAIYTFYRRRPKSLPKRVIYPVSRPDLDKLERAINDALTAAGVWVDDGQVSHVVKSSNFCREDTGQADVYDVPGVIIELEVRE